MIKIWTYLRFHEPVPERLIHKFSLTQSSSVSPERVGELFLRKRRGIDTQVADLCKNIINVLGGLPNLAQPVPADLASSGESINSNGSNPIGDLCQEASWRNKVLRSFFYDRICLFALVLNALEVSITILWLGLCCFPLLVIFLPPPKKTIILVRKCVGGFN